MTTAACLCSCPLLWGCSRSLLVGNPLFCDYMWLQVMVHSTILVVYTWGHILKSVWRLKISQVWHVYWQNIKEAKQRYKNWYMPHTTKTFINWVHCFNNAYSSCGVTTKPNSVDKIDNYRLLSECNQQAICVQSAAKGPILATPLKHNADSIEVPISVISWVHNCTG